MLFNSFEYLIFLPLVGGIYFMFPHQYRWGLLLIASYTFYAFWKAEYLVLIIASTLVDYYCSLKMHATTNDKKRKMLLLVSIFANIGTLFIFKYLGFAYDSYQAIFDKSDSSSFLEGIILPMGISFYTFQSLSYTVDVYRRELAPERHFGKFALYVSFFPQLVAGPIERARHLLPQMSQHFRFSEANLKSGLRLILWGLLKKVVIADRLALFVNPVYENSDRFQGATLLIATIFFAFQIYCDFSGYSDIAIGSARIMGFDLMKNFRMPYFSSSISEFWKRWHISLSTWFKDYVYIPLGGNRVVKWRWYYNLFITFLISGFWHGANWTFIIWGAIHGIYLIFENLLSPIESFNKIPVWIKTIFVFMLVNISWVFFRADSVSMAFNIISRFADFQVTDIKDILWMCLQVIKGHMGMLDSSMIFTATDMSINFTLGNFLLSFVCIIFLMIADYLILKKSFLIRLDAFSWPYRWAIYYLLIFICMYFGVFQSNEFIYFQF
jgi:alginate O-acetyltransferase complex protein AlgI